ncbi:hypothetical protein PVAP13_1KG357305 [Panicum virgatum]|uniref:PhoD-like phosphatase metallophosphatase domain-containing protein n=1 Tax=Panicum virgatum TaxID=38727 RepID=A0A8T0XKH1_PANVG|nr:hypothetical protein PVAP13_1KG357305 [Panicum virgatum]
MAATFRLLILLLIVVVPPFVRAARDADAVVSRIAFGSCANQSAPQPIWDAVVAFDPQVFVWLGDNVYGDNKRPFRVFGKERTVGPWKNVPRFYPSTEQELRRRYQLAKAKPGYASLRERAQVILLDTRYHRDPLLSDGTILGDPQWQWLERELHGPQSEITVIGSSIQRNGVIFVSGDVHFGEIARFDCGVQYPLYDVTSSGLTQSVDNSVPIVFQPIMRLLAVLAPTTMRVLNPNCLYKSCTTGQPNFGAIEIDWNALPPRIKLELRDVEGRSVHSVEFPISELQPSGALAMKKQEHAFQRHCTLETELPWLTQYWLALLFFGTIAVFIIAVVLLAITCLSSILTCSKKTKKE